MQKANGQGIAWSESSSSMLCVVERARFWQENVRTSLIPLRFAFLAGHPPGATQPPRQAPPRAGHTGMSSPRLSHRSHGSTSDTPSRSAPLSTPRDTPRCDRPRARLRAAYFEKSWIVLRFHPLGGARTRRSTQAIGRLQCGQTGVGNDWLTGVSGRFHSSNDSIRSRRALAAALSSRRAHPLDPDGKTCCRKRRRNSSADTVAVFVAPSSLSR